MARKKPARRAAKTARKKAALKTARRKAVKKAANRALKRGRKAVRSAAKTLRKATRKGAAVKAAATKKAKRVVKKAKRIVKKAKRSAAGIKAAATTKLHRASVTVRAVKAGVVAALTPPKRAGAKTPNIDRPRKTVADIHGVPSSLGMAGIASAAHSGRAELKDTLKKNTSASPALTAGDVDADWQSAETTGDEAPGGDNPTPDQDVVDEIGRALGVEYEDDEELQGGAEIAERDAHRWELDPSSKDDFDDEKE